MRKGQEGVSITELAVVVAIIGLLLASIVGGTNLLSAAKAKKLIAELEHTKLAIDKFEQKYSYLPGDYDDASTMIDGTAINGNGNTDVDASPTVNAGAFKEDLAVWQHLALAEMIRGSYTGTDVTTARYQIGVNAYTSEAFPTAVFSFYREPTLTFYQQYAKEHLILSTLVDVGSGQNGLAFGGAVTPRDAFAVDEKIDDGNASKGRLLTLRANVSGASGCVTGAYTDASANYILDDATTSCRIAYVYNTF